MEHKKIISNLSIRAQEMQEAAKRRVEQRRVRTGGWEAPVCVFYNARVASKRMSVCVDVDVYIHTWVGVNMLVSAGAPASGPAAETKTGERNPRAKEKGIYCSSLRIHNIGQSIHPWR